MIRPEGFNEVVFSVSDLSVADFYTKVAGWEKIHEGPADPRLLGHWHLPASCKIEEVVLKCPSEDRGYLRLVKIAGAEQVVMRSGARDFDPGGFFYTQVRTRHIESKLEHVREFGYAQTGQLKEFDFDFFHVKECISKIHDDIRFSILQSYRPSFDIPPDTELTALFNVAQVVSDIVEAKGFYVDKLGFQILIDTVWDGSEDGMDVLDLNPKDLPENYALATAIVHPEKTNIGSIELMQHIGLNVQSYSHETLPPNLGNLTVRFPVSDLESYVSQVQSKGVILTSAPSSILLEPFGEVKLAALQTPDGAWLEFYQTVA